MNRLMAEHVKIMEQICPEILMLKTNMQYGLGEFRKYIEQRQFAKV